MMSAPSPRGRTAFEPSKRRREAQAAPAAARRESDTAAAGVEKVVVAEVRTF